MSATQVRCHTREEYERFLDGDITAVSPEYLDRFFGPGSRGDTLEERARTATQMWVRGESQLSPDREDATGMRLTTWEVYELFGLRVMDEAHQKGSAILVNWKDENRDSMVVNHPEPAASLIRVRERLGLSREELAKRANLALEEVQDAENRKKHTSIWTIDKICRVLGLDVRRIGFERFE